MTTSTPTYNSVVNHSYYYLLVQGFIDFEIVAEAGSTDFIYISSSSVPSFRITDFKGY